MWSHIERLCSSLYGAGFNGSLQCKPARDQTSYLARLRHTGKAGVLTELYVQRTWNPAVIAANEPFAIGVFSHLADSLCSNGRFAVGLDECCSR